MQHVGGVMRLDVELRAGDDEGGVGTTTAIVGGVGAPPGVIFDRRGADLRIRPPLDRLVVAVVVGDLPLRRRSVVPDGGHERRRGRQVLQVDA